jgi:hypothetical protein
MEWFSQTENRVKGTIEAEWEKYRAGRPYSVDLVEREIDQAFKGVAPRAGCGLRLKYFDGTRPFGLGAQWAWFSTQREMVYFVGILSTTPHIFGRDSVNKERESCISTYGELDTLIQRLLRVKVASAEDIAAVDKIYGPHVEWLGLITELESGNSTFARRVRQEFRAAASEKMVISSKNMDDSPLPAAHLEEFRTCFSWPRIQCF